MERAGEGLSVPPSREEILLHPWTERRAWAEKRRKPSHGFPLRRVREGIIPSRPPEAFSLPLFRQIQLASSREHGAGASPGVWNRVFPTSRQDPMRWGEAANPFLCGPAAQERSSALPEDRVLFAVVLPGDWDNGQARHAPSDLPHFGLFREWDGLTLLGHGKNAGSHRKADVFCMIGHRIAAC